MKKRKNITTASLEKKLRVRKKQEHRYIFWEYQHELWGDMSEVPKEIDQVQLQDILKTMYKNSQKKAGDPQSVKKTRSKSSPRKPKKDQS